MDWRSGQPIHPFVIPSWLTTKCVRLLESITKPRQLVIVGEEDEDATRALLLRENATVHRDHSTDIFSDAVKIPIQEGDCSDTEPSSTPTHNNALPQDDTENVTASEVTDCAARFRISQTVYQGTKDTIAATFNCSDDKRAYEPPPAVILKLESIEAHTTVDATIERIAGDFTAKLITFDPEDLEDLAADFHAEQQVLNKVADAKKLERDVLKQRIDAKRRLRNKKARVQTLAERKAKKIAEKEKKLADAKVACATATDEVEDQETKDETKDKIETMNGSDSTGNVIGASAPLPSENATTQLATIDDTVAESSAVVHLPSSKQESADEAVTEAARQGKATLTKNDDSEHEPITLPDKAKEVVASSEGSKDQGADIPSHTTNTTEDSDDGLSDDEYQHEYEGSDDDDGQRSNYPHSENVKRHSMYVLASKYFSPENDTDSKRNSTIKRRAAITLKQLFTGGLSDTELSSQPPTIVHLRYCNRLLQEGPAFQVFAGLKQCVKQARTSNQQIVLVVTIIGNEKPYKVDDGEARNDGDDDDSSKCCYYYQPCERPDLRSLLFSLDVNGSSIFNFKTIDNISNLRTSPQNTSKSITIRRLKRHIRHSYDGFHDTDWLDASATWPEDPVLDIFNSAKWKHQHTLQAAQQIVGRGLKQGRLTYSDVSFVVSRLAKAQSLLAEDDATKKFDEKLAKIRKNCNEYEERLLESVVKPATLTSTYEDVIVDAGVVDTVKQMMSLYRLKTMTKSAKLLKLLNIGGAMFYGPPGTGKTHLCRAIATDQDACMLAIDPASIMDMWLGETEKLVKASFTLATKLSPCVQFIDEADALFRRRSPCDESWQRASLTMFLSQMDGISTDKKRPFVVVATNRPSDLDDAFLRRLPHKVRFDLPEETHRLRILQLFMEQEDLDSSVDLSEIAKTTIGFSGSDLKSLCGQAVLVWATEQAARPNEDLDTQILLSATHFKQALKRVRPTVSQQALQDVEAFARQFEYNA